MAGRLEALLLNILSVLKSTIGDYCDLETTEDEQTIVSNDGSLVSIVQFHGTKQVIGEADFDDLMLQVAGTLDSHYRTRGHQIQFLFTRDLDATPQLQLHATQQHLTAERLGLDLGHLIDESAATYASYVYEENCFIAFWTRPAVLHAGERAMDRAEKTELRKETDWPATANAQDLLRPISYMRDKHNAFVSQVVDGLNSKELGCAVDILDIGPAFRAIRRSIYPDTTPDNWSPATPGRSLPLRWKGHDSDDESELLYPTLPEQIMTEAAEQGTGSKAHHGLADSTMVRIGARTYAPLLVTVPPRSPKYFNELFNALNRSDTQENGERRAMPWTLSFMLESDAMSGMTMKQLLSGVLGFTSSQNRNFNAAMRDLNDHVEAYGKGSVAKLRIAAMTWSGNDAVSIKELSLRKAKLMNALSSWGLMTVVDATGNPLQAVQSSALALSPRHLGTACPVPMKEVVRLLPLTRPTSPFRRGSLLYRSLDGKLLREELFSSDQKSWVKLFSGGPGSGKSVTLNNMLLEACLLPGLARLPYISIIDIGISSKGFIDELRASMPEHQRHLAVYKRLQNTADYAINIFDTPPGNRSPLMRGKLFQQNFITALVTPPEREVALEGMTAFVSRMIDLAYLALDDRQETSSPRRYSAGHHQELDAAVAKYDLRIEASTTYFQLADAFFLRGDIYWSEVAQRYAVPVLNDLISVSSSTEIRNEYKDEAGQALLAAFQRGIRDAVGMFPVFAAPTKFDIGSARVVALDLQDVAGMGGLAGRKQSELMFMIAPEAFKKKVAFSKEDLPYFMPIYAKHYARLVAELADEPKILCMDEVHKARADDKTGMRATFIDALVTEAREGRKWRLGLVLASQFMSDFGDVVKLATGLYFLESGDERTRAWIRENCGLTPIEEAALIGHVRGGRSFGSTFLARFQMLDGEFSQLFTLSLGPQRLWALTTTAEDRKLRDLVLAQVPRRDAMALLAEHFPSGGCKAEVDRQKNSMASDTTFIDEDISANIVERIAKRLIASYYGPLGSPYEDLNIQSATV